MSFSSLKQSLFYHTHGHGILSAIFGSRLTEGKNIVKLLTKIKILQFQLFLHRFTFKFLKNRQASKKDKKYRKLKIYKFIFSEQNIVL